MIKIFRIVIAVKTYNFVLMSTTMATKPNHNTTATTKTTTNV
jgi:hypothetical protein